MAGLSVAHRAALAHLITLCPPELLDGLRRAVGGWPGIKAQELGGMLNEVDVERRRRERALGPLSPMFRERMDGIEALTFPAQILPRLWAVAREGEIDLLSRLDKDGPEASIVGDRLCLAAAAAVRDRPDSVWPRGLSDGSREAGLEALARCLDLAHLARKALRHLETWLGRPDGDSLAELRLLIRDASAIHEDGAPRLIDILFAHLKDAALVLRLVTQTSGSAGRDDFLSASEMAVFVERLIAGVEVRAARVAAFRPGPEAGPEAEAVLEDIRWCTATLGELDVTLEMQPGSAWGKDVRESRLKVARRLTETIRSAPKVVEAGLPMTRATLAGRMTRKVPDLNSDPASPALATAAVQLRMLGALRSAAAVFGCESDRKRQADTLVETLSRYADEAFDLIHGEEIEDLDRALALMEAVARLLTLLDAQEAARTVRRRAAATIHGTGVHGASPEAA
jgi:hypothetical protein